MPKDLHAISIRSLIDLAALLVIRPCLNKDEVFITDSRGAQFMQNMRSAADELVKVTKNVQAANQFQKYWISVPETFTQSRSICRSVFFFQQGLHQSDAFVVLSGSTLYTHNYTSSSND
jgi:hypothetical protein